MKTHEKINFLIKITEVSNHILGKALNFDASYISRIRTGKRNLPRSPEILESVSSFFASHIESDVQKKLAAELICPGSNWPDNFPGAQRLIADWLQQTDSDSAPVGKLISGISNVKSGSAVLPVIPDGAESEEPECIRFFYGNEGKRQAVELFLSELLKLEHPPRLLLYSNEEFSWMYEDSSFSKKWAALLFSYIKKGGRIRIAHTISRASGEMLVALQKWIPVYMTGAIEPYYYPKILDRVFRKTLFIAEEHSAISGSSVGEHVEGSLSCLTYDLQAVRCMEREYWNFAELCKPLMQIYNMARRQEFLDVLKHFNGNTGNMITVRTSPSFYTMPRTVARSMTNRLHSGWIMQRQQIGTESFASMMERGDSLTEILNLPSPEEVLAGRVAFPMSDLFDRPGLFYTGEEFRLHLESMIDTLKTHQNYHAVLTSVMPANEIIHVKEDLGAILVKNDLPSIAFAIHEQRMVSAFWDYLSELAENGNRKDKTIRLLEQYAEHLH